MHKLASKTMIEILPAKLMTYIEVWLSIHISNFNWSLYQLPYQKFEYMACWLFLLVTRWWCSGCHQLPGTNKNNEGLASCKGRVCWLDGYLCETPTFIENTLIQNLVIVDDIYFIQPEICKLFTTCKFLIMSTEFDKNFSNWSWYSTDNKSCNEFFFWTFEHDSRY